MLRSAGSERLVRNPETIPRELCLFERSESLANDLLELSVVTKNRFRKAIPGFCLALGRTLQHRASKSLGQTAEARPFLPMRGPTARCCCATERESRNR